MPKFWEEFPKLETRGSMAESEEGFEAFISRVVEKSFRGFLMKLKRPYSRSFDKNLVNTHRRVHSYSSLSCSSLGDFKLYFVKGGGGQINILRT